MRSPYQAVMTAPFGMLGLRIREEMLAGVDFLPAATPALAPATAAGIHACRALEDYFSGSLQPLDLPIIPAGTAFQRRVWAALRSIPAGRTLTYGELAASLGSGARAVANACGANPVPLVIPCHRVVARDGLGGFMQGRASAALQIKQWLLQHERSGSAAA